MATTNLFSTLSSEDRLVILSLVDTDDLFVCEKVCSALRKSIREYRHRLRKFQIPRTAAIQIEFRRATVSLTSTRKTKLENGITYDSRSPVQPYAQIRLNFTGAVEADVMYPTPTREELAIRQAIRWAVFDVDFQQPTADKLAEVFQRLAHNFEIANVRFCDVDEDAIPLLIDALSEWRIQI